MRRTYELEDLNMDQLMELAMDWREAELKRRPIEEVTEPGEEAMRALLERRQPCPGIKRDGLVCGSTRVSADSGYCFAHDPKAAEWRAMGGRAKAKKARARKKLRELGLDHMTATLEDVFDELHAGNAVAADARAMTSIASTMMKLIEWAAETDRDLKTPEYDGWTPPYEP